MSDLISRKEAIDALDEYDFEFPDYMERFVTELRDAMKADLKHDIEALPSAEPERKTGKWVKDNYGNTVCSECLGIRRDNRINYTNFCNQCGVDMREGGQK